MTKKDIIKTTPVHLAWSPKSQHPIHLVAGTAAEQLDPFASSSASIELYEVDLTGPTIDLNVRSAFRSDHRFHKLIWDDYSDKNIIVGGCDSGALAVYDSNQLLERRFTDDTRVPTQEEGLIACFKAHSGPVRALDFTLQKNLLVTGTSSSEIFIWDLNKELAPIQELATEPLGDITSLSSNKQVQYIIATAFARSCLVWDLRTSKKIITLSDTSSNVRWKDMKWNPETGSQHTTQLCLASEEDQCPIIQMWDLRKAATPIKIFEGHEKGVLSLDWSNDDPEIMISSGKDNKLLLWNLNNASKEPAEIIREIPLATEHNFEVSWCPKNPNLISSSSSSGPATIFTWASDEFQQPPNMIADSFPGVDQYQQPTQAAPILSAKAPKWMKRTSGVFFGFGGKLLTFGSENTAVDIFQVITEPNLDEKFKELDNVLEEGDVYAHCMKKYETADDPVQKTVWNFMAGQFYGENFKDQMYTLLGISKPTLQEKLNGLNINVADGEEASCDPSSNISHIGPAEDIFTTIAAQQDSIVSSTPPKAIPLKIPQDNDIDTAISEALLLGNLELAIDLCLKDNKIADAFALAMSRGPEMLAKVQSKYFEKTETPLAALISTVVTEDWFNIVDNCDISSWKQVLVALLTYTNGCEFRVLCESLGSRLSKAKDESLKQNAVICYILAGNANLAIENYTRTKSGLASEILEAVELGLLMREAMKARSIEVPVYGTLSRALLRYAELLASQGFLTEAYSYLGESTEEIVQELKDRLMVALGLRNIPAEAPHCATNGYAHRQNQNQPSYENQYGAGGDFQSSAYNNPPKPTMRSYNQPTNTQPPFLPSIPNHTSSMFPSTNSTANSIPSAAFPNYNQPALSSRYPTPGNPVQEQTQFPRRTSTPEPNQFAPPTAASIGPANSTQGPNQFPPSIAPPFGLAANSTLAPKQFPPPTVGTVPPFGRPANSSPAPNQLPPSTASPFGQPVNSIPASNQFLPPSTASPFGQPVNSTPASNQFAPSTASPFGQPINSTPASNQFPSLTASPFGQPINSAPAPNQFAPPSSAPPLGLPPMPATNSQPPSGMFSPPQPANPAQNNFYNPSGNYNSAPMPAPGGPVPRSTSTPTPPPPSSAQAPYSRPNTDHNVTQGRTKYVLDPSVKGGSSYGNNQPPITHQPMAAPMTSFAPQNQANFYPHQDQNHFYAPGQPQQGQGHNSYSPNSQQQAFPPTQPSHSEIPPMLPPPKPGQKWNDPPPLGSSTYLDKQAAYVQPNPIAHPMYGSAAPENNLTYRPPSVPNEPQPNSGYGYGRHTPQTSYMENHHESNNYQNNVASMPQRQHIENTPAPKPALPEHHVEIQTVLENLRSQCVKSSSNLQMRRKLDDTSRKLETLYDSIRDSKLSPRTLQGLHDIIKAIENRNYPECLSLHTQLVSGSDFSAIASFMPSIKVLVQSAMQLGVYL